MAQTKLIRQVLDPVGLHKMINSSGSGMIRDVLRRTVRVESAAKLRCPVDMGRLRSSITHQIVIEHRLGTQVPVGQVGTNVEYAMMVHNGTGIYGPRGAPIVPTHARVMVFTSRTATRGSSVQTRRPGARVYVRQVAGQRGRPFLKQGLLAMRG